MNRPIRQLELPTTLPATLSRTEPWECIATAVSTRMNAATARWATRQLPSWLRRKKNPDPSVVLRAALTLAAVVAATTTCSTAENDFEEKHNTTTSSQHHRGHLVVTNPLLINRTQLEAFPLTSHFSSFRRHQTLQKFQSSRVVETLHSKYKVKWSKPLGEGSFGTVYLGKNRLTGEEVAVKKIAKRYTDNASFQREIEALLHIRENGGHPNICGLQENYDEGDHYYLVLDLVSGGEMFDQLCAAGAYSEADAARVVREVASALAFMHGIGIVHGDLKPENLMLTTGQVASAVIKVVDFGCAFVDRPGMTQSSQTTRSIANTPAYSPPEALKKSRRKPQLESSFDMFSLGVILYIVLTGVHPYDLYGNASDEEIEHAIVSGKQPPLGKSAITAHLSDDALSLIKKLLSKDPRKRLSAQDLLDHPWVRGETARTSKIADSDKRLSAYRAFKTKLGAKVFKDMVDLSDNLNADDVARKTSLIERSFLLLNPDHQGYVTSKTLQKLTKERIDTDGREAALSLSGFSDLLAENLQNRYFPKGHVIYKEGDKGNAMYFINSGSVEVFTKDGAKSVRTPGDCFGEGALLSPKGTRSASIRCITPVHAIEINREYFEKFLSSDAGVNIHLREKDKFRKRQRAKTILQLQKNMTEVDLDKGDFVFRVGEDGNALFIIEEGKVDVYTAEKALVLSLKSGEMTGEYSLIFGRPRNVDAKCVSEHCKLHSMRGRDFYRLLETHPSLKESIRDICLRREFQKAICAQTGKPFPKTETELRAAFNAVDKDRSGAIELRELRTIIKRFDPFFTEQDIREVLETLDLDQSGKIHWAEFKRMFGMSNKDK